MTTALLRRFFRTSLVLVAAVAIGTPGLIAAEIVVESAAFNDPKLDPPPATKSFHPRLKELWLAALAQPQSDLKREAADAITKARTLEMPGLEETIKPLTAELAAPGQHPLVKFAVARALILLDARDAAPALQQVAIVDGAELAQLIEPALAAWKFEPMRKTWLDRLSAPNVPRGMLVLAIRGLAEFKEAGAASKLLELANDASQTSPVRLEAAKGLGKIRNEGLLDDARKLAANKSPAKLIDRLVAASMLAGHSGKDAEGLLSELAIDQEPTVAAVALAPLLEFQPEAILSLGDKITKSPDANVRRFASRALIARPNAERVEKLAAFLDDHDTAVRIEARNALYTFAAEPQYRDLVIRKATEMLASDREVAAAPNAAPQPAKSEAATTPHWRGLEQSSILLGGLDHKPAADRLAELIAHPHPQVFVAAAWALRTLQVKSTLPAMLARAKAMVVMLKSPQELTRLNSDVRRINDQIRELFQAFGLMKFADAEMAVMLAEFIPKGGPWEINTRCAAIWAGGYILEGESESETGRTVVKAFTSRLNDVQGPNPEDERVRRMSAVSLGRMKAKSALGSLREFYAQGQSNRIVGYSCAWAIRQITGEDLPDPPVPDVPQRGWFLEPLE